MVVATYKEWDEEIPAWACPGPEDRYSMAPFYQRLDVRAPRFVPNYAFEAGIYLRFVKDYYYLLPKLAVFLQADAYVSDININPGRIADLRHRLNNLDIEAMRSSGVGYLPMNDFFVRDRTTLRWYGMGVGSEVQQCWEQVARWYGHADAFDSQPEPTVSFYCCNYFAVLPENILRTPFDTWKLVYELLVEHGTCHPGHVGPDRDLGKHEAAGTFEHLAPLIWGDNNAKANLPSRPHWVSASRFYSDSADDDDRNEDEDDD